MPGMDRIYEQTLRKALGQTEFTQKVVERIGQRNKYARGFLKGQGDDGEEEKVFWRGPEDHKRFAKYSLHADLYINNQEEHLAPEWMPSGKTKYKRYNLCRFLTDLYTQLMMGSGVEIHTEFKTVDDHLNDDLEIGDKFDHWAKMVSVKGMIGVQVVSDDRGVDVVMVQPELVFAEFEEGSEDDYKWVAKKFHVDPHALNVPKEVWEFNRDREAGDEDDGVVFEERHYRGRIEYFLYTVKEDEITELLLPEWYNEDLPPLDEDGLCSIDTGIDEFMLLAIPNVIFNNEFISDYEDITDLQRDINSRITHINRILNVHANPKLMLPESFMGKDPYTGEPIMRGLRDEVLFIAEEDKDNRPEYLTWNSQIEAGFDEIDSDVNMFCTVTGVSPSLIVRKDTTFPEAASAYKLRLTPTLAKTKFKTGFFKRYLRRILWVLVQKLTTTNTFSQTSLDQKVAEDKTPDQAPSLEMHDASGVEPEAMRILSMDAKKIEIRFEAALPQDDRLLVERTGTDPPTASIDRVLREVDGMSDAQVAEEKVRLAEAARLKDEQMMQGQGSFFGGGGGGGGEPESFGPVDELDDAGLGGPPTGNMQTTIGTSTAV